MAKDYFSGESFFTFIVKEGMYVPYAGAVTTHLQQAIEYIFIVFLWDISNLLAPSENCDCL